MLEGDYLSRASLVRTMSSCTNCARSFSLLNREKACAKCGFAFCSKCLLSYNGSKVRRATYFAYVFSVGDRIHFFKPLCLLYFFLKETFQLYFQVCAACHKAAESGSVPRPRSPPTALERRLERLASVPQQPITVYSKESEKMTRLKRGLSQEDKGIAERLQRLQRYVKF